MDVRPVKTVVLDDDPTGTQSATDVAVLFDGSADELERVLATEDSVYVQTNSRAVDEAAAVALVSGIRREAERALERLGAAGRFVLRGDSTLRGHVFAEIDAFAAPSDVVVFAPAFPAGGRVTLGGVHYVERDGVRVPAAETEYAADPVFPFSSSELVGYVAEKSDRPAVSVPVAAVRGPGLAAALRIAAPRTVVLPDIETDDDARRVADAVEEVAAEGRGVLVRCAAPLAAALAGVASPGLLREPLVAPRAPVLVVCGSHTSGATAQLETLSAATVGCVLLGTDALLRDEAAAVAATLEAARGSIRDHGIAIVATERSRRAEHGTLADGERVMRGLIAVVRELVPEVELVISKGGITASETASAGIGARSARVVGQLLPGVSVWRMADRAGRSLHQVIVPGNVGGPDALLDALRLATGRPLP